MTLNVQGAESGRIVSTIDPKTVNSTGANGDAVDMGKYDQVTFVCSLGDMAAETIDFLIQTDDNSSFTSAATLKSATQRAAHASNNDNTQLVINVRASELPEGDRYVRPRVVTGNTTGGAVSVVGITKGARHEPADDLASVAEIVN